MKEVGRNDPCPCGSGKKFKKCCALKSSMEKRVFKQIESRNLDSNERRMKGILARSFKENFPEANEKPKDLVQSKKELDESTAELEKLKEKLPKKNQDTSNEDVDPKT